ncbi:MAG TPA: thioredoxin family protein [Sandaracinaceae bacterium LLY-WYZ-13_1]|nr:thioredoxin family protein [Sandaracinaceae bacterium LLY-WYZ-13_1]
MIAVEDYLRVDGAPVRMVERGPAPSPALVRVAAMAPWLTHTHAVGEGVPTLAIEAARLRGSILWLGEVDDRLLEALVETLRALATGALEWDTPATVALLDEIERDVGLDVYVGPRCPYCPAVTAAAARFAVASPRLALRVIRADRVPHPSVRSTPTVLADGRLVHAGAGAEYPLAEALVAAVRGG